MENSVEQNDVAPQRAVPPAKRKIKVGKVIKLAIVVLLFIILAALAINAVLTMFKDDYYTTIGDYRFFAIVTDSMEPEIPTGSMIVSEKPTTPSQINAGTGEKDGTVITYKLQVNGEWILLTHRVIAVNTSEGGIISYTTRGDNAPSADSIHPTYSDVVGVYTGNKLAVLGSIFGFFQSSLGVSMLIFCMFVIVIMYTMLWFVNHVETRRLLENAALKKSAQALSGVNLRYDNINEITAVMDVLGMVTEEPSSAAERKEIADRLAEFVRADNIELPHTPETAAILDSLPAPDTPGSLASALASGATLRQAEDGQTLVLTTMSGGKNILLTPVQTSDGIILCQQGVRLRSDMAPNIEQIGVMSMPSSPEFFEGRPLEKNVEYPELPQPQSTKFVPEMLSPHASSQSATVGAEGVQLALATPSKSLGAETPDVAGRGDAATPKLSAANHPIDGNAASIESDTESVVKRHVAVDPARRAFAEYRERSAVLELEQAEQLAALLSETTTLTAAERQKVAEYRAAHKPKPRKPRTAEQKERAREAAERKKHEREEFLQKLNPEDRELYLTEQKLARSIAGAIRKLKRIAADRKLLEKLD